MASTGDRNQGRPGDWSAESRRAAGTPPLTRRATAAILSGVTRDQSPPGLPRDAPSWHAMSVPEALARSESSAAGLAAGEARGRLAVYGPNRIRVAPPTSAWAILVAQLRSVVMALLVA